MAESREAAGTASADDVVNALELLILRANRFVSRIAEIDSFRDQNVGVADWLALRALSRSGKETFTSLARTLGVTRQRVKQIADSLKNAGLVSVTASGEDKRKAEVEITAEGAALLARLEGGLRGKLGEGRGAIQPALRAGAVMHRLTRALAGEPGRQRPRDPAQREQRRKARRDG